MCEIKIKMWRNWWRWTLFTFSSRLWCFVLTAWLFSDEMKKWRMISDWNVLSSFWIILDIFSVYFDDNDFYSWNLLILYPRVLLYSSKLLFSTFFSWLLHFRLELSSRAFFTLKSSVSFLNFAKISKLSIRYQGSLESFVYKIGNSRLNSSVILLHLHQST